MSAHNENAIAGDSHRQRRRRLLAALGTGMAGAYVAPTLFSVGQARASSSYSSISYSRPSYSRPSYSRPSGYEGNHRRRVREYKDDPTLILEDIILGPPDR
ncbi:hypothetical protein [Vreelandella jeotgali]|uniref:hypothetical protein n=1 Tax=Vreelandella jeotgali TaxID=553386 RepID=UPI00034B93DF|nr:hypothetical protein [Halomonas jeotgali]